MRQRQVLRYLPVALLCVGIAVHGARIIAFHDDPQRGTAFAMFATVDIEANRQVQAVTGDPEVSLEIPDSLSSLEHSLIVAPSEDAARRLAERLLVENWTIDGEVALVGFAGEKLAEVRVQVVGLDARGRSLTRLVLVRVVRVAREGDAS